MNIKNNLLEINEKILIASKKSGRSPEDIKLMAVSKFHPIAEIQEAINCGQLLFGENRVQEAMEKFSILKESNSNISLHMIGSLQSNKVKNIVKISECIQSVDRIDLLTEIEKQCAKIDKKIKVLFEIHTGEESKAGFTDKNELLKALDLCSENHFPHIIPNGFMTMAPFTENKDEIRKSFSYLRELSIELKNIYSNLCLPEISMGMSGDFEIAIEEGSTLIRVGTAIFGERNYNK